ncbi:Peptide chain release factor 1-like, mitochondrial [Liparis tanakae]|uniref:Peptide chain release factor 1-like, mitochondrial n=1 Tax=Liparis tanakae TaxID=230148 RepID=A0A4Z2DZ04_9TELE|nr:Peptide chain release factor 1-like, mitochondrial [Liparis tanakae]
MALSRARSLLLQARLWVAPFQKSPNVTWQNVTLLEGATRTSGAARALHAAAGPLAAARLLSVDELFAKRSLQEHLKKLEAEYSEGWRAAGGEAGGPRAKRANVAPLAPLVHSIRELEAKQRERAETEELLTDEDPALRELAELEYEGCQQDIQELRQKVKRSNLELRRHHVGRVCVPAKLRDARPQVLELLLPQEEADLSDLVLEVTAGVGGQEAMLFTDEVFDMYRGFARHHGWSFDILEHMTSEIGQRSTHC